MAGVPKASVDRSKSREEAEMQFTSRERLMIRKLEMIATGRVNGGADPALDLQVAREIATEGLKEVGWPTVGGR